MSATIRRAARSLVVLAAVPVTLALSAPSPSAAPDPGATVTGSTVTAAGCDSTGAWPVYPGWRGPCLRPELRGHVLEFLDR
jgi:hypothetical protein